MGCVAFDFFADRKALEEALAEEEDEDDFNNEKVLNMNGDDGEFLRSRIFCEFNRCLFRGCVG